MGILSTWCVSPPLFPSLSLEQPIGRHAGIVASAATAADTMLLLVVLLLWLTLDLLRSPMLFPLPLLSLCLMRSGAL